MPAVLTFASIRGATEDEQQCYEALEFQPTCPVRGTTRARRAAVRHQEFQSTRPLRGATSASIQFTSSFAISIHAPRTGRDYLPRALIVNTIDISIHAPLTGRDCVDTIVSHPLKVDFNPRAPYGARRPRAAPPASPGGYFNPRAPYGARLAVDWRFQPVVEFQSTCPVRGTTLPKPQVVHVVVISIHVPRTGHDSKNAQIVFCIFAITDNKSGKVIM